MEKGLSASHSKLNTGQLQPLVYQLAALYYRYYPQRNHPHGNRSRDHILCIMADPAFSAILLHQFTGLRLSTTIRYPARRELCQVEE